LTQTGRKRKTHGSPVTYLTLHFQSELKINFLTQKNLKFHSCSKHNELQFYFIQAKVSSGEIRLKNCSTRDMVTDILTKSVPKEKHDFIL
jgi:hypothetical protein